MNKGYFILVLGIVLCGCATTATTYLNTSKNSDEIAKDKAACQAQVDASDFTDSHLKQNKFDQCMQSKGYNVVSEAQVEKIQGFKELWVKPEANFKAYEVIVIAKVDVSQAKANNEQKVSGQDIDSLGEQMLQRFSKALGNVIPVISDKEKATGKKVLYVSLKLNNISQTNVGANVALEAVGFMLPVPAPLPDAPEGAFSFDGEIADYSSKEKLIAISDEVKSDKNSSILGADKFSPWQRAYDIMDYWADWLAVLLAKERGQEYKSKLGIKIF
jgi:hypothetical protein